MLETALVINLQELQQSATSYKTWYIHLVFSPSQHEWKMFIPVLLNLIPNPSVHSFSDTICRILNVLFWFDF